MKHQNKPRGQALIIIVFAIIGLIAMVGVAVDGGNVFSARRHAQSAADDGALAGALTLVNHGNAEGDVKTFIETKYQIPSSTVTVTTKTVPIVSGQPFVPIENLFTNDPFLDCGGKAIDISHVVTTQDPTDMGSQYIQVMIRWHTNTYFGEVVGVNKLDYCVQAIARARARQPIPAFLGNAVVGLDPGPDSLSYHDQSNSTKWYIDGGGVFANSDAEDTHSNVVFTPAGMCATAVQTATGFTCSVSQNNPQLFYPYPTNPCDADPNSFLCNTLPRIPACNGFATYNSSDGKIYPDSDPTVDGSVWDGGFAGDYAPGLYCITDANGNINDLISGVGVTFYIQDTDFTLKFVGGGSNDDCGPDASIECGAISATAPTSGDYKGMLIFSDFTAEPCTQNMQIRGNGNTPITGTIFMPSACLDYRGNGIGDLTDSQMIGYDVTSNGTSDVALSYSSDKNWEPIEDALIELTK